MKLADYEQKLLLFYRKDVVDIIISFLVIIHNRDNNDNLKGQCRNCDGAYSIQYSNPDMNLSITFCPNCHQHDNSEPIHITYTGRPKTARKPVL